MSKKRNKENFTLQTKAPSFSGNKLRFIPLGGNGQVTKNMFVYEHEGDIVIVDCGMGFPSELMYGVDMVIPEARSIERFSMKKIFSSPMPIFAKKSKKGSFISTLF